MMKPPDLVAHCGYCYSVMVVCASGVYCDGPRCAQHDKRFPLNIDPSVQRHPIPPYQQPAAK